MVRVSIGFVMIWCGLASWATAHSGVQNHAVMVRMEAMVDVRDHIKFLAAMAQGKRVFDAEAAQAAAAGIARHAAEMPGQFVSGDQDPKSEALPLIWTQFDDFTAKAQMLYKVAADVSQGLVTEVDLRAGVGAIGAACTACHDLYRD